MATTFLNGLSANPSTANPSSNRRRLPALQWQKYAYFMAVQPIPPQDPVEKNTIKCRVIFRRRPRAHRESDEKFKLRQDFKGIVMPGPATLQRRTASLPPLMVIKSREVPTAHTQQKRPLRADRSSCLLAWLVADFKKFRKKPQKNQCFATCLKLCPCLQPSLKIEFNRESVRISAIFR
jgi:hypothetical protein